MTAGGKANDIWRPIISNILQFTIRMKTNEDEYIIIYTVLCLYFSTKCHLLMKGLVVAFVLFVFTLVLLCF